MRPPSNSVADSGDNNWIWRQNWHVRTKANIERVRKDEEKVANEEKEKQRKIALAEQEARTDLLRVCAQKRKGLELEGSEKKVPKLTEDTSSTSNSSIPASGVSTVGIYTNKGNINLFKAEEDGDRKSGKNAENEADKKAEKEKWEKDIGLLTYLGQSAVETQEKPPWYLAKKDKDKEKKKERPVIAPEVRDRKIKESMDPLRQMTAYLDKTHKHREGDKVKHHKHKHKSKKDRKPEKKDKQADKPSTNHSTSRTIEQLRAERLNREQEEKKRTAALLYGESSKVREEPINERERGYNNLFNPDFVRRPRNTSRR